jgi:hypothetical protein
MTIRLFVDDLPKGHAAAGKVDGDTAVVIVDRACLLSARDRGDAEYGARIVNDMFTALEQHGHPVTLSIAS